jgi:hypothetical protein
MKKWIIASVAGLVLAMAATQARADDKAVTITGDMVCGKCTLHETASCQNVIQVKKEGKTTNYYLAKNDVSDAMHEDVCHGDSKKVTATGKLVEKDGKQVLTASKLEAAK